MHSFPRPEERFLYVERTPVPGTCPECQAMDLAEYPVFGEGGWWQVVKCQRCLSSVRRERGPLLGSFTPLTST